MCRNIRPLNNFAPPATTDEVRAAALQYVRKVSGTTKPSAANQEAFDRAVEEVAHVTAHLLEALVTTAPPKDREVEAAKARARAAERYGRAGRGRLRTLEPRSESLVSTAIRRGWTGPAGLVLPPGNEDRQRQRVTRVMWIVTRPKLSPVHMGWMAFVQVRGHLMKSSTADGPQASPPAVHTAAGRFAHVVPSLCTAVRLMSPTGLGVRAPVRLR